MSDEYDERDDDDDVEHEPEVCRFCGNVTTDGLMLFPQRNAFEPYWSVCKECIAAALRRDGQRPNLRYARSPN